MRGIAPAPFWLIARRETSRTEIFTETIGGQRRLPVFCFREEAEDVSVSRGFGRRVAPEGHFGWGVDLATLGTLRPGRRRRAGSSAEGLRENAFKTREA